MRISDWSSDVCSSDLSRAGTAGSGSAAHSSAAPSPLTACCLRMLPPWAVTKLGQKPFTQEKSLLQDDWSMARLRPNSVSTGTTETQLDCTEQSPQPSQTSSLMKARFGGSG